MRWNQFELKQLEEDDFNTILKWRNSSHIRNNMLSNRKITVDEHQAWFQKHLTSHSTIVKKLVYREKPIGLVSFSNIDHPNETCYWGIYIGDETARKGSGTALAYLALNMIFDDFNMRKVNAEVIETNHVSLSFHKKLGFVEEGRFKEQIKRDGKYIDVFTLALFKDRWKEIRDEILRRLEAMFHE